MNNEVPVIKAFENAGFEVIKGGWPDLLVHRDGKLRFIEIKGNGDKLSRKQIRLHELLKTVGITVEIVKPRYVQQKETFLGKYVHGITGL